MAEQTAKIIIAAEDRAAPALASVQNALRGLSTQANTLVPLFGALGASLSIGSMLAFVKNTNDGIDALNDLKDATGASIENISALEDIAGRTGTSFDSVGTALVKFNQLLNEAKPGSDAEKSLAAIGLKAEELRKLDPAEGLRRYAVALGGFADDGNKARLVQDQLGKSLREVAPFLNDLKEKGSLVAKVTTEQAEEAEKFNKQLFELEKNAKDAGRALVSDLVTGINAAGKAYRESGLIAGIQTFLTGDDQYKNNKALVEDSEKLLRLENQLVTVRGQGYKDGSRVVENLKAQISQTQQAINTTMAYRKVLEETSTSATPENKPPLGDLPGKAKKSGAEQIDEQRTSLAAYVKGLNEQLYTVNKISESQQALNFLAAQGAQGQVPQVRELVLGLAERVDQEKKIAEVMREQNRLQKDMDDAYRNRLQGMLESGPAAKLEKTREDIQLLTAEFEEGHISEERYLDAVTGRLNLMADGVEKVTDSSREFGFTFNSALEDAILNGKEAGDVVRTLGQDIGRMILRENVTKPLANSIGSIDFSSIFSKFSFDGGGFTGPGSRSGGLDGKGGFMAMLHPNETVIDHTRVQPAGGGIVQNVNIQIDSRSDQATILQAVRSAVTMAKAEILDSRNRGGAFA